jgi:type II secretory pathway pseudopilin PulG
MNEHTLHRLNSSGISMVELIVGITLLAVVVLSLSTASLYASRTVTRSRVQLAAAEFQQAEIEALLAVPYAKLQSGSRSLAGGTSKWEVVDSFTYRRIMLVTNYAPAEAISVSDTVVAYRVRR